MSGAHWTVSNATAANKGMVPGFYYAKFRTRPEALRALRAFVKAHAPSDYYGEQDSVQASATGSDGYHDWKKETVRYNAVKDAKGKLRWKLRAYDPYALTERTKRLSRHEAGGNPSVKKPSKSKLYVQELKLASLVWGYVLSHGGVTKKTDLESYSAWELPTEFGLLRISEHFHPGKASKGATLTIFAQFAEPARSKHLFGANPYSGKWNFHFETANADDAFKTLKKSLDAIVRSGAGGASGAKHESGRNPSVKKTVKRARKPSFKRGDFVRVKGLGTWVGKITFGPQLDTELGLKKWKVTRDFDGLQKWWNDTSLEKLSKKGSRHERASRHEAGKNPITKREFDTLTKEHGGTGRGGDSGLARDEIAAYRRLRKRPGRGSDAMLGERDLLAVRAAERARHPTTSLRGLQSAPKAAGGMAYLRSWGESISKPLRGDPHQLATMSREELKAYRGGAGKKDASLKARIDKLLGKK
jgi:hypothetical protein